MAAFTDVKIKFYPSVEIICAECAKSMVIDVRTEPEKQELLAWCVTKDCKQEGKVVGVPPVELDEQGG